MEFSSPLAAMRPAPAAGPWGHRRDLPPFRSQALSVNSFNFKEMSMDKPNGDYFMSKTVRGSSPTVSLAADLSQNFHIDQSPQVATPRRSLFTVFREPSAAVERGRKYQIPNMMYRSSHKGHDIEGAITPPIKWEGVTTPPVPSSSPGYPSHDMMDFSPLPHKAPFFVPQVRMQEPTPEPTPMDSDMITPTEPIAEIVLPEPKTFLFPERRRPTLLRPSLQRGKFFSTNTITAECSFGLENQLPSFTFGAGKGSSFLSSSTTLDECFADSPPQERKPLTTVNTGAPRPRQLFTNINGVHRNSGSPLSGHVSKKCAGPARPRKLMRRSASMFEHPGDIMKQEKKDHPSSGLQSIVDVDETHNLALPHFIPEDQPDSLPRINKETLVEVLNGKYNSLYDTRVVIDCRFEYEFNGGHIEGAEHHDNRSRLSTKLFDPNTVSSNTLLIFHCEYSEHRAPLMAKQIRQDDRAFNVHRYPKLTYPEIYILDGGYKSFFTAYRIRCFPQNYIEMGDKNHEAACDRGMQKVKQRGKFERSKTFAFGQGCHMQDSPTAQSRGGPASLLPMDLSSPIGAWDSPRPMHPNRRMLSY